MSLGGAESVNMRGESCHQLRGSRDGAALEHEDVEEIRVQRLACVTETFVNPKRSTCVNDIMKNVTIVANKL